MLRQLGVRDRAWDIQIGIAAVRLKMQMATEVLRQGIPVILESNYKQECLSGYMTNLFRFRAR
jgi:hypothetical protein